MNAPTISVHHDVLFRFGSWCYAGRVQLTPTLTLSDIPFVIPALRMQQSRYLVVALSHKHIPHTLSIHIYPFPPAKTKPPLNVLYTAYYSSFCDRLDYYCDVAAVPTNSPFAPCLNYIQRLEPLIEREIYESEDALQGNRINSTAHP